MTRFLIGYNSICKVDVHYNSAKAMLHFFFFYHFHYFNFEVITLIYSLVNCHPFSFLFMELKALNLFARKEKDNKENY